MITVTPIRPVDFEIFVGVHALDFFHFADKAEERPPVALDETSTEDDAVSRIRRKHCRILVVDDGEMFRASLIFKLQDLYGATVEEAESGPSALDKVSEERAFDLILMDISMPEMSGIEACEAMRSQGVGARIVLMSAYYSDENWAKAQALGATLLHKPLDEAVLENILLECGGTKSS